MRNLEFTVYACVRYLESPGILSHTITFFSKSIQILSQTTAFFSKSLHVLYHIIAFFSKSLQILSHTIAFFLKRLQNNLSPTNPSTTHNNIFLDNYLLVTLRDYINSCAAYTRGKGRGLFCYLDKVTKMARTRKWPRIKEEN